jgi:hypothetical protein
MTFADSVKYNGCVEKTGNKNNIYIILWDNFSFQEMHFRKKRNFPQIKKHYAIIVPQQALYKKYVVQNPEVISFKIT